MMKRIGKEDKRNLIIICLFIVVLLLVSGFSTFAQYVAQESKLASAESGEVWSINFSSAKVISEDGGNVEGFTYNPSSIVLTSNITQKGGKVALEIVIKNRGQLDAKVADIKMSPKFTGSDDLFIKSLDGLSVGDVIKSGESVKVVYTVKHNANSTITNEAISNSQLLITYVQA